MTRQIHKFAGILFVAISSVAFVDVGPAHAGLIGISTRTDTIYSIDPSNGAAAPIGPTGGNYAGVGASFLGGELFATDLLLQINPFVIRTAKVNISTATSLPVGNQDGSLNWHGLASDEGRGLLYSIAIDQNFVLKSMTPSGVIATIGPGTGIDGRGMAFDDRNQILYATNSSDESLYSVDISTGIAHLVGPFGIGIDTSHSGLAYDEENQILYLNGGVDNISPLIGNLYSVNVMNGAATLIGSNGIEFIDGVAWLPDQKIDIPEPTTASILVVALIGLHYTCRRRKG